MGDGACLSRRPFFTVSQGSVPEMASRAVGGQNSAISATYSPRRPNAGIGPSASIWLTPRGARRATPFLHPASRLAASLANSDNSNFHGTRRGDACPRFCHASHQHSAAGSVRRVVRSSVRGGQGPTAQSRASGPRHRRNHAVRRLRVSHGHRAIRVRDRRSGLAPPRMLSRSPSSRTTCCGRTG